VTGAPTGTDVLAAIRRQALAAPDRPAIKDLERDLTYAALVDDVATVAAGLAARGVGRGDRVGLHLPNSVDFAVGALASLWLGAVFVPLAMTDPVARLAGIVGDCQPAVVLAPDDGGIQLDDVVTVSPSELRRAGAGLAPPEPVARRVAYAIYTSGTTGTPKGVLIGNAAFAAAVSATVDALGLDGDTRTLCVSPFHFDGSFGTLFPTLAAGGSVVIRPRDALLFPRTFFTAVANESITYTGFSPSYLGLLLGSPQLATLDGSSLQIIALGGEASSAADIEALWSVAPGVRVFNRYGPTETTIAVTHLEVTPEVLADGTVPIGVPHPGVTFHLVDESGGAIEGAGQVGELLIGGDQLMEGYWGAPELTRAVLRTDVVPGRTVYRTGDLAYRDEEGRYVYVGRADRVVKRSGVRISLAELGDALRILPGVSSAACTVFDDDGKLGIAAFVVGDANLSALDLRNGARDRLPDAMMPDRIELVPSLPLTASGKLDERRLLAGAGLDEFEVGAPPRRMASSS
jgi:amino acid adenylation domain-containing protein